jgi:hypothetical protein
MMRNSEIFSCEMSNAIGVRLRQMEARIAHIEAFLSANKRAKFQPAPTPEKSIDPVSAALAAAKPEPQIRVRPAPDRVAIGDGERLAVHLPQKYDFDIGG